MRGLDGKMRRGKGKNRRGEEYSIRYNMYMYNIIYNICIRYNNSICIITVMYNIII